MGKGKEDISCNSPEYEQISAQRLNEGPLGGLCSATDFLTYSPQGRPQFSLSGNPVNPLLLIQLPMTRAEMFACSNLLLPTNDRQPADSDVELPPDSLPFFSQRQRYCCLLMALQLIIDPEASLRDWQSLVC